MKQTTFAAILLLLLASSANAQSGNINNTLGSGGTFTVKDGSNIFLTLSQSNGNLTLTNSLNLQVTTSPTLGVITKGANSFIHDYQPSGADGHNTFVGENSGNFTMSGTLLHASYNTAVGAFSLSSLTTGYLNSAFGCSSLMANATGSTNSAFGFCTLYSNTTGRCNCAFGYRSLYSNINGIENSAFGDWSLNSNIGDFNCAFGHSSLDSNTTGNCNSAFGYNAGSALSSGSNNTMIGYDAEPSATTISNEITLGNSSIATLRCQQNSITALSDARDKKNIRDLTLGLEFLMNVKPRLFNWDRREWYKDGEPDGSKMQTAPTAGFIAQELDEVQTKENAGWMNLVLKSNPDRLEATPGNLLPIMVKAIQELKTENDALKNELATLCTSIDEQVKKEVKSALLKAVQQDDATAKVSLKDTQN